MELNNTMSTNKEKKQTNRENANAAVAAECLPRLNELSESGSQGPLRAEGAASPESSDAHKQLDKLLQILERDIDEENVPPHRHPKCRTVEQRLQTFRLWPANLHPANANFVINLTEVGFFYSNQCYARCFHCDGEINIDYHLQNGTDLSDLHTSRFPRCEFAQRLKKWRQEKCEDKSAVHQTQTSGTQIGLPNILTNRSRSKNRAEGSDSSVDDSSGEQSFWKQVHCGVCDEPVDDQSLAQCFYCKKAHHMKCLQSAMRMREEYNLPPRAECIDLHSNPPIPETSQGKESPSCRIVGGDSNAEIAQYIIAHDVTTTSARSGQGHNTTESQDNESSADHWTCADFLQLQNWIARVTQDDITAAQSRRDQHTQISASTTDRTIRLTCPDCQDHINRICDVCRDKLSDRRGTIEVVCSACSCPKWFHYHCLTPRKKRGIYEDRVWICPRCDTYNTSTNSSSDDST